MWNRVECVGLSQLSFAFVLYEYLDIPSTVWRCNIGIRFWPWSGGLMLTYLPLSGKTSSEAIYTTDRDRPMPDQSKIIRRKQTSAGL